jgi:hypothetical protein
MPQNRSVQRRNPISFLLAGLLTAVEAVDSLNGHSSPQSLASPRTPGIDSFVGLNILIRRRHDLAPQVSGPEWALLTVT